MKRPFLVVWFVGQLIYLAALYFTLNAGVAAQRTHNYSILRELESKGLLTTNSASLIEMGQPGHGFSAMKTMRTFHSVSLVLTVGWTLVSIALLVLATRSKSRPH